VKPALVFAIRSDAALQRLKVRQKIAVSENDPARLGRRARSVKNFGNGARVLHHPDSARHVRPDECSQGILKSMTMDGVRAWQLHLLAVTQDELHAGIP